MSNLMSLNSWISPNDFLLKDMVFAKVGILPDDKCPETDMNKFRLLLILDPKIRELAFQYSRILQGVAPARAIVNSCV